MNKMKTISSALKRNHCGSDRRGTVIVLAAAMLVVVFGIAAFTVDLGLLNVTKGQVQNAADSAAHAAMQELIHGLGPGATVTSQVASENAGQKATNLVRRFRSGDVDATDLSVGRDMRFGRRSWNSTNNQWVKEWGVTPFNMVEVSVRRTKAAGSPLGAVFSQFLGFSSFDVEARSVASVAPITGFSLPLGSSSTIKLIPIALDLATWNALVQQIQSGTGSGFQDQDRYNAASKTVSSGSDRIPEVNIYPDGTSDMPSGNRGTVDIGYPDNSTADLIRQITHGVNAYDLSFFPNRELKFNNQGVLYLQGDTGISAGLEASLQSGVGTTGALPIFISVSGPGNNATYTIVRFVGVRIMAAKLDGGANQRYVRVQPASYSTSFTTRGNIPVNIDALLSQPLLIE